MAPEQTGRMNRGCGFASDLYGLGGTLYLLLTGRPPFLYDDPLELIHAHLAREPVAPAVLRSEIPDPLSRLVLKLLSKEPEERYSSATSLRDDLLALRDQMKERGQMDPAFRLESIKVPDSPRLPTKLYGRAHDRESLLGCFEGSVAIGPRVAVIEGASGSGKSTLVDSLRGEIAAAGGYLARGVCDPRREIPMGFGSAV